MRQSMVQELAALGSLGEVPLTEGAFYFLLRVNTRMDPLQLVERLVREHGVAVIPGNAFGLQAGCHLRVAYGALTRNSASEASDRLVRGLQRLIPL